MSTKNKIFGDLAYMIANEDYIIKNNILNRQTYSATLRELKKKANKHGKHK